MATNLFILYGAGDPATKELVELLTGVGFPFTFKDIRTGFDGWANLVDLNIRHRDRKGTVPWLVHPSGVDIGGYEAACAYVDKDPAGTASPSP